MSPEKGSGGVRGGEEFEEMFDLTGMVFCSKYCSDQLIAKNLRMQQFIQTLKGQNNFW